MTEILDRHTMVTLSPAGWSAVMAQHLDAAEEPLVADWARTGRPLVVRRRTCADAAGLLPLGLPLPPKHGKRRLAVAVAPDHIVDVAPPPLLASAAESAPCEWRETIARLLRLDPQTRAFGSLAWQYLTGLVYLADESDLDLLWQLPAEDESSILLNGIAEIASTAPMRIDGEIIAAVGGVQWRELLGKDTSEVLLKGRAEIRMIARTHFLSGARQ